MKEIINKLIAIEKETSAEKGDYDLFALFLRENSPGKWDILVAAKWIENMEDALRYLAGKIQGALNQSDFFVISHIAIIDESNPALPGLFQEINIEHSIAEMKNFDFAGQQIKRAYLITSMQRQAA